MSGQMSEADVAKLTKKYGRPPTASALLARKDKKVFDSADWARKKQQQTAAAAAAAGGCQGGPVPQQQPILTTEKVATEGQACASSPLQQTPAVPDSMLRSLVGSEVTIELKNDLCVTGILVSVDQFLNLKLQSISVAEPSKHPHLRAVKSCFIRGSVVRYISLPASKVDVQLLHDATRIEARTDAKK